MKRKIFSLSLTLLLGLFSWNATAATGWYEDYIKISVNEGNVWGPSGYYWIDTNPGWATNFVNGFGNVTSMKLDGADIKYWSDTQDRTSGSLFYQVTSADGLNTYTAFTEITTTQTYLGGNNYQGLSAGLNTDLLAGVPAGKACKLTIYAKSTGTGQGDSYLSNFSANYVATFTKASVAITGATGIADGTSYTTLKGAFDAINANASGVNTDKVSVKVYDNTTETATAVLNPSKGVSAITTSTAGSGFVGPKVSLTGGTNTAAGTTVTTVTNGVITSIVMTGGNYSVVPTGVTIGAAGSTGANGASGAATVALSGTNLVFTVTNGGTGYGPTATVSGGSGTGATVDVKLITGATAPGSAPAGVGVTYTLACAGSGYTSSPTASVSAFTGATVGGITAFTLYPSIEFSRLAIYPTVASKTITGVVGIISLVGRKNVAIDGRVNRTGTPTVGNSANLTISSTHATNPVILLNSNAQNDTVQYCTLKGQEATSPLGILNFGAIATLANGNGLNVIDRNLFNSYSGVAFTMPTYAIYAQGNSAFPNASNQITNNEFKDLIAQYQTSTTLYITGGVSAPTNDNYTISGNSFYSANIPNYASSNYSRAMLQIGTSVTAFGGSHTISGNYFGGSAASCSGMLTKTDKEATFNAVLIYPSPTVTSGGGLTRIQGNTIKNISWINGYFPAGWNAINIGGGTGGVSIGTTTPNSIGDNTTNNSITVTNVGASNQSLNLLNIGTSGSVDCQNNKIGSVTASNTTSGSYLNVYGIVKSAVAGTTTISNNVIGSTTQANSISATSSGASAQGLLGIYFQGTGSATISNNTIANLTNTATTGNTYGINMTGATGGFSATANGNLIHSISVIGATTGLLFGIQSGAGRNIITNNVVKLGDNNAVEIRAISDASGATSTINYHNTVYLTGTPTSVSASTFISACLFSSGTTTTRKYKNNLLVNTRSNGTNATGTHYAISMAPITSGIVWVSGNDYVSTGTGGKLGTFSGDKTSLPIVTGHDTLSVNVAPSFVNASGSNTAASDYMLTSATSMTGVSGTGIVLDFNGASRGATGMIGAFETIAPILTTSVTTLSGLNYATGAGPSIYLNSFDVSGGSTISGNITITAPTNFEVSKTGVTSEYTPSVTVAAVSGSVSATTIYVRLVGGLSSNTYTGNVTVSATNALNQTVACTGVVDITVGAKTALSDGIRIINANGQVIITGAKSGQLIQVYNASGSLISSTIATEGDNRLTLPSKGFQLIKVGTEVRKVMVK